MANKSDKLPWTRLFAEQWAVKLFQVPTFEGNVYMRLRLQMLITREPLLNDLELLAHCAGCSIKRFEKALDYLIRKGHIICLEDGSLWNSDVEDELNNSDETFNKYAERSAKAANTRKKNQNESSGGLKESSGSLKESSGGLKESSGGLKESSGGLKESSGGLKESSGGLKECNNNNNNNNINIYNKKTNTIVLAKKEIEFEDSEITDLVEEPIEVDACESQSDQITTSLDSPPPIHEQKSVPKKAKRSKANRGCRLPADFEPDYDFAINEGLPPERVKVEIAKFRDYWKAKSGANATKTDWQATWRNWVRNSKDHKNKQGRNYGNYTQRQKSIGERIADSILDIGNRGYFEAHSRDVGSGLSVGFERWQQTDETAGSNCFRGW
ncbi:uncharacterized protein YdaU (DUF1376 family) [Bartonella japonica]|uniref:Uncharacterized protein YdaU (DUF1376 family) n=1 Tax=Bartonella japonica TaxID=357761 RepID=A0ABV2FQI8_9HYPH